MGFDLDERDSIFYLFLLIAFYYISTPFYPHLDQAWTSLVAQTVKNLSAMQEAQVQSLGGEDPLEKGMATHSSILAWEIPLTEKSGGGTVHGDARVGQD